MTYPKKIQIKDMMFRALKTEITGYEHLRIGGNMNSLWHSLYTALSGKSNYDLS